MLDKELARIKENTTALGNVEAALQVLEDNRVIYFLRAFGRPHRKNGQSTEDAALEGLWSSGWQDCLDTLINFREIFIDEKQVFENVKADYGALDKMLANNEITKEEYEYLRSPTSANELKARSVYRPKQ